MKPLSAKQTLEEAIHKLEILQAEERQILKEDINAIIEKIKPSNLIKSALGEFKNSSELKSDLLNTTLGIATGYISKKLTVGNSHNPIKNIFGELLQIGISNIIAKDSSILKSVFNLFTGKKNKGKKENLENEEMESNY